MAVINGNEKCLSWSEDPDCVEYWDSTEFTWSDCILIDEILEEIGGGALPQAEQIPWWNQKDKTKLTDKEKECKKRLITLITTVKGETFKDTKEVEDCECDPEITVSDIHLVKRELEKRLNVTIGE